MKNYDTNKTEVKYIDNTWSLDLLDMIDCEMKNTRGDGYILVVIQDFSK